MSTMNIDQVLAQMRLMSAQASGETQPAKETGQADFGDLLKQSIDKVNETQQDAGALKKAFEMGEENVNLAEVMAAIQKSSLSFEAMVQVRNKLVEAYKDVMNMPI
ncbi:flagellar hook-basal body complex protein FliE [Solemya velesiana gill symbiont]|uniref:Flagellar hook-basal body complex protein FliE n=1 Tax=Solemya velesiana gill symbiont TaxID=1918948 RepID=A0A1T2KVX8_9GAMM|nr:flagellar hook-basal body complex protein FliE [Solemya velesiana gill symbiont]OOZ37003.1 flagellar hook-basal body complex protein FliE [Solemya velesiana gill symbiont]